MGKFRDLDKFDDEHNKHLSDDRSIKMLNSRANSDWYEKNNARHQDPEYLKKLSSSIKSFYAENPDFQKEKVNSPNWKEAHNAGVRCYVESPDYVHPQGMLGKKRSEESLKKQSEALSGRDKPLKGNAKIGQARKGRKPTQESIDKMSAKLTGRESGRSRKVKTPAGTFDKLYEAAAHYEVAPESIKNYIAGKNVKEWFKPHLESKGVKFKGLKPLGFSWLGDAEEELGCKPLVADGMAFENTKEAGVYFKVSSAAIRERIKKRESYYYITKKEYEALK